MLKPLTLSLSLAVALGDDLKGMLSLALYLSAIPLAFVRPWIAILIYVTVAVMWLVPDTRIESLVKKMKESS